MANETDFLDFQILESLYDEFKNSKTGKIISKLNPKLLNELKEIVELLRQRAPRIMIIGRRGSGKSSLINAIIGENRIKTGDVKAETSKCEWVTLKTELSEWDILDSRGAGEGGGVENPDAKDPIGSAKISINEKCPDLILFICKAKEVDANIEHDVLFLDKVIKHIKKQYSLTEVNVIGVINQCDELTPKNKGFDNEQKQKNISIACNHLLEMLQKYSKEKNYSDILPICSYMEFSENNILESDERWNIEKLLKKITDYLPNQAKLKAMKMSNFKNLQKDMANKVVNIFSAITGIIGTEPIPIADLPLLSSLQVTMMGMIAAIAGRKTELKTLKELLAAIGINIGTAFVFREIARSLAKIWVGNGNFISGGIAAATTKVYGNAAIKYFIDNIDINEIKKAVNNELVNLRKKE